MRSFEKIELKANAKVNLSLDIVGFYPDGMHKVETVMHTVNLFDAVTVGFSSNQEQKNKILVTTNKYFIPSGEKNLAYQAACRIMEDYPVIKDSIYIHLQKRIPAGAGLGGGSSDAAATIRGLNSLLKLGLSHDKMKSYAAKIGSDVPFLLEKGACLATGTGTELKKIPPLKKIGAVLVNPGIFVSTKDVYAMYDACSIPDSAHPNTKKIIDAIAMEKYDVMISEMKNVLEIPVFQMHPQIKELKEELLKEGCDAAMMSGSGSTVFGLSRDYEMLEFIKSKYISQGYRAFVVSFVGE